MPIELPDPVPADSPPVAKCVITIQVFDKGVAAMIAGPQGGLVTADDIIRGCGWGAVTLIEQMAKQASGKPQFVDAKGLPLPRAG